MKYTIHGFSQQMAVDMKLDTDDLLILRWLVDFSPKMSKKIFYDKEYFWVNYKSILEDLPILSISKDRLYRKLSEMVKKDVLKHQTFKNGGTFSYYSFGEGYEFLISYPTEKNPEGTVKTTEGYGENTVGGTVKTTEQNNPSTKYNPSTTNPSFKLNSETEVSGENQKGKKEKKVKVETEKTYSLQHRAKEYWLEKNPDYVYGGMQAKALQSILGNLKKLQAGRNFPTDDDSMLTMFQAFIQNLPDFYKDKDLNAINSGYNTIINQLKNKQNGNNQQSKSAYGDKQFWTEAARKFYENNSGEFGGDSSDNTGY